MLVSEHAPCAVHALLRVVKRPAILALEFVVIDSPSSLCELLLPVGETTLALIPALGCLNPILAQLSLILAISIVLDDLLGLLQGINCGSREHHHLLRVERLLLAIVGIASDALGAVEGVSAHLAAEVTTEGLLRLAHLVEVWHVCTGLEGRASLWDKG